jgi:TetR/AcrR family transcriptional regulator, transcriptional repressor of bet genes
LPKIVNPEKRRAEFVRTSWDVIAAEGLSALTLRRVASEAGCTTGSLTHYFPDRFALLAESLRLAHFSAGARMIEVARIATSDFGRLEAVLLEALPLDEERLTEWKVWIAFWGASSNEPILVAENARRYDEWRELLETVLAPLAGDADKTSDEVDTLIAMIDGLGLRLALFAGTDYALQKEQSRCVHTLRRQISRLSAVHLTSA